MHACQLSKLSGDGHYTKLCHEWLENHTSSNKALLTHSCTAALEIAAILADLQPGDEIIMPSYTFVSTANAFVLRGAIPVFVDVRLDNCNIDETLIEAAITNKTKAIVPVHYAGVACEMDTILKIARKYDLIVIEDAAQGVMSTYKGRPLGSIGDIGTYSFHETKNIISGEGGALLINNPTFSERSEIIREKGTNRSQFFRGKIDKYSWVDIGSSYLPSDIIAAFLWAQICKAEEITSLRMNAWNKYHELLSEFESKGMLTRPHVPSECAHNAHMYYVLLDEGKNRDDIIRKLDSVGINAIFHYVPLHSAPQGLRSGRISGSMSNTDDVSRKILRLPMWVGVDAERVVEGLKKVL
jgi:dTDP-4-amino-4,6-dideoxygalactose transaminase